jgi:hypothetical protein
MPDLTSNKLVVLLSDRPRQNGPGREPCVTLTPEPLTIDHSVFHQILIVPDSSNQAAVTLRFDNSFANVLDPMPPSEVNLAPNPADPKFANVSPTPRASLLLNIKPQLGIQRRANVASRFTDLDPHFSRFFKLKTVPSRRCGDQDEADVAIEE